MMWHDHTNAKQSTMKEKCSKDISTYLQNKLIQPKHAYLRKKRFSMCCYFSLDKAMRDSIFISHWLKIDFKFDWSQRLIGREEDNLLLSIF